MWLIIPSGILLKAALMLINKPCYLLRVRLEHLNLIPMFDLIIIGGGPAGYVAAERAGHKGLSVLLFERKAMGGVCLNEGCIPTKTMLYSAKIYENALHGDKYGVYGDNIRFDYAKIVC